MLTKETYTIIHILSIEELLDMIAASLQAAEPKAVVAKARSKKRQRHS